MVVFQLDYVNPISDMTINGKQVLRLSLRDISNDFQVFELI